MSYNINIQHIVFRTYASRNTIPEDNKRQMLAFINDSTKQLGLKLLRINAHMNHVHILVDLGANINVATYVKTIKANSSRAFSKHPDFPLFEKWAKKYASFSISRWDKDQIINYIRKQEEHHRHKTFAEELVELFGEEAAKDPWWRHDWLDEPRPDADTNAVPPALAGEGDA